MFRFCLHLPRGRPRAGMKLCAPLLACVTLTPGTPRPGQWSPRARVVLSQSPSGDSAQRKLLGLVAQSADFVGELARAQLPDSEEVARAAAEAEAEAQLAAQKLESRRLRRSWDARLSWRRRKREAAEAAAAAAEEQAKEQARSQERARRRRRLGLPPLEQGQLDQPNGAHWSQRWSTSTTAQAEGGAGECGEDAEATADSQVAKADGEASPSWAPTLATAAAVTAAAVMQAAEMAAVTLHNEPRNPNPHLTPTPTAVTLHDEPPTLTLSLTLTPKIQPSPHPHPHPNQVALNKQQRPPAPTPTTPPTPTPAPTPAPTSVEQGGGKPPSRRG